MEAPHTRLLRLEARKYTPFLLEVEVDLRAVVGDFEDHPLGDAGTIAADSVIHVSFGHQRAELLEDGLDEVWWDCGYGDAPSPWEA
jgi:hypothetical protein